MARGLATEIVGCHDLHPIHNVPAISNPPDTARPGEIADGVVDLLRFGLDALLLDGLSQLLDSPIASIGKGDDNRLKYITGPRGWNRPPQLRQLLQYFIALLGWQVAE